jgi:hypothetical protein
MVAVLQTATAARSTGIHIFGWECPAEIVFPVYPVSGRSCGGIIEMYSRGHAKLNAPLLRLDKRWLAMSLRFPALALFACSAFGQQLNINFSQFSGPSEYAYGSVNPPLSTMGATFSGGMILTGETNIVVGGTVYGAAQICSGCASTITISFATGVTNFGVLLINGLPSTVTYTLTDNNGTQVEVPLTSFATQSVILNDTGITQVTIAPSFATTGVQWDFSITNVKFTPGPAALVDPVPTLITKAGITTDATLLSSYGTIVKNVAADGVTQVVVRIQATSVGEQMSLVLYNSSNTPSTYAPFDGSLSAIGGPPGASSVTVTAISTPNGPMAFAVYTAPDDFARLALDDTAMLRSGFIAIQSLQNAAFHPVANLNIVRPPVFLIHGLWDSAAGWVDFTGITADIYSRFYTGIAEWGTPMYVSGSADPVKESSIGIVYSAPKVLKELNDFVSQFKNSTSTASVQVDVIAHSMGGLMTKGLRGVTTFTSPSNYGKGPIHKVITIGTPHLGSPLAIELLTGQNGCIDRKLDAAGLNVFGVVTPRGYTHQTTGAVYDLQGNGLGVNSTLSPFLLSTVTTNLPLPMALVAGEYTDANLVGLYSFQSSVLADLANAVCPNNTITLALAAHNWPLVMGTPYSDGIVPLTSELDNQAATSPSMVIQGIVHSNGAVSLGFDGPTELNGGYGTDVATQVIFLLNEFVTTGTDFKQL